MEDELDLFFRVVQWGRSRSLPNQPADSLDLPCIHSKLDLVLEYAMGTKRLPPRNNHLVGFLEGGWVVHAHGPSSGAVRRFAVGGPCPGETKARR